MEDLRVPKRAVPVEVVLPGGEARQVSVYLSRGGGHASRARAALRPPRTGRPPSSPPASRGPALMTFLHRGSIAVARVPVDEEPADDSFTIPTEHEVEITLADGTRLTGLVAYVAPESRERLVDFLNRTEPFFRLLERDRVALVGRAHVARVALLPR